MTAASAPKGSNPICRDRRTIRVTDYDQMAAGPDAPEQAESLGAGGLGACYVWYRVLAAQADRLAGVGFVPDGYVFVLALRNLRRAAAFVASALPGVEDQHAAAAALAEFDRALPGVEEALDVLEHFDDYIRGIDFLPHREQTALRLPVTVDLRPAGGLGRQMVLSVEEFAVPITDTTTAACLLLADIHAAHSNSAHTHWTGTALRDEPARQVTPSPTGLAA